MSISVVTPAPNEMLTTVEAVKLTLGITDPNLDDTIEDIVLQASDWIKRQTARTFGRQVVAESFVGKGLPNASLSITPIISITSLTFKGAAVTNFTIDDAEAGIIQIETGFTSSELAWNTIDRAVSPYAVKDWICTYEGGYVLPSWQVSGQTRNLPYDLERACIELSKTIYIKAGIDGSLKTYKVGDTAVSWGASDAASGMPVMASSIVDFYRRAF